MHISEGVLSAPVLISGRKSAAAEVKKKKKKTDYEGIVNVAILSSAFFVASLIHVNLGPSSVHLILNGIVGLLLGWAAFPAILVALLLQAVFFQYGGITVLGVNTVIMAVPAIVVYYLFSPFLNKGARVVFAASAAAGAFSIFLSAVLLGAALYLTEKEFLEMTLIIVSAHIPVMIIEAIVTGFCVTFLKKVYPEILPEKSR